MKYLEYAQHINADEWVLTWVKTTLANYLEKNNPSTEEDDNYKLVNVVAKIIDGKKIKEDVWYTLKNGEFVEI